MDFILNGRPNGSVAEILMANDFNVNALRPWIGQDGRSYVSVNTGGKVQAMVTNSAATLRKDEWKLLDDAIIAAARPRLKAVADLRAKGLVFNIPNGMSKTVLETETMSDTSDAEVSMDGLRESQGDRPHFDLTNLPLPIIHKDFSFSARQIAASRNGGSPVDTVMAEQAGRRVAEMAEKFVIGSASAYTFGGGTIYGYTNYTGRLLKVITSPVASGWTPAAFVAEILAMRKQSTDAYHYGPWMLYVAPAWDQYLDADYSAAKGDNTLRERVKKLNGVEDVQTLDYLSGYQIVLVQMTSDVVREVVGMDITTLQWESNGGLKLNFKVMAILVPQLRMDFNSRTGIVHGNVA